MTQGGIKPPTAHTFRDPEINRPGEFTCKLGYPTPAMASMNRRNLMS